MRHAMQVMEALKVAQSNKAQIFQSVIEIKEAKQRIKTLQSQLREALTSRDQLEIELQRSKETEELLKGNVQL